jgi:hypothetical protein
MDTTHDEDILKVLLIEKEDDGYVFLLCFSGGENINYLQR